MPNYEVVLTTEAERLAIRQQNQFGIPAKVTINGQQRDVVFDPTFLGYIPIIGVITGIFRVTLGAISLCFSPSYGCKQLIRGTAEICCVGIVYHPFDAGILKFRRIEA
jgi:hypothetical protein